MGRSAQSKKRRQAVLAQRKADKKAAQAARAAARNQPESEGMMSAMWNMLPSFGGENEVEGEYGGQGNQALEKRGVRAEEEQGFGDQKDAPDDSWKMWDLVPSFFSKTAESEDESQFARMGGDENHVDLLSSTTTTKGSAKVGGNGLNAEAERSRSLAVLTGAGEAEGQLTDDLHGKVEGSGSLGLAEASAKGSLKADKTGVDAKGEIGGGLYAGKVEAGGSLGYKIPFVNAMLSAGGKVEGSVGVGGSAEGHLQAGPSGYSMGGKVSGALGAGVGVGYSMGLSKADPDKGWFDQSADKTYE